MGRLTESPAGPHRRSWRRPVAAALLLTPVVALSWVPWYAQDRPRLAGVPFFYWYQFAWIPGCALAMFLAYLVAGPSASDTDVR